MKAERWGQVERLFFSTLEKEAGERAAFLAEACGGDEGLRREVESLLAYDGKATDFIETPAVELALSMIADEAGAAAATGQSFNQYTIVSPLGAGGMGEVYLAEDTRLGRRVALKFLPAHLTRDQAHLRRFEQEALAVAALSHPNVCTIHEVVETAEGRHCLVMEYVPGVTLLERLAAGRMAVGEAVATAVQIASALGAAHAAGMVHRDVKPENIVLRPDGYVKVLDFGLAKLGERPAGVLGAHPDAGVNARANTSPGMVLGTALYMSPEQARGLPVDARSDVWSLGVVLYEMLAGRPPFTGATPTDLMIAVIEREPVPLSTLVPDLPLDLVAIVERALAKDREERFPTGEDLSIELKALKHRLDVGAESGNVRAVAASSGPGVTSQPRLAAGWSLTGSPRRRVLLAGTLAGLLILAGLLAATLLRHAETPAGRPEIESVAVLPLENLSGDPSQDYFADGMTEALITDLAKVGELRVMSQPSVMPYKGVEKPLPEIGRELGVHALLTGSVVRAGDRVRIAVQLIDAASERSLWADSYERDLTDVLALQREVTRDIVDEIRIKLTPEERVRFGSVRPIDPAAYDHYLQGQFHLNRQTREDNDAAIAALERSVAVDPGFAAAHAELAQAYVWRLFLFAPDEEEWEMKAFVEAEKALALDPASAVAHLARGRALWTPANRFPHERAIDEYRRALELNPSLGEARNQLALVYSHIGAFDEALQESRRAIATNPNNSLAQLRIGSTLNFQGKHDEALSVLRALPRDVNPELVGVQVAWALFNLGRQEEASAMVERVLRDHPEDRGGLFTSLQAVLAASAGQADIAEERILAAVERGRGFGHFHHTAYQIACAYALMGEPGRAIGWLEAAADDGFPCYALFAGDPNLDPLRADARFVAFLAKMKEQWERYQSVL